MHIGDQAARRGRRVQRALPLRSVTLVGRHLRARVAVARADAQLIDDVLDAGDVLDAVLGDAFLLTILDGAAQRDLAVLDADVDVRRVDKSHS